MTASGPNPNPSSGPQMRPQQRPPKNAAQPTQPQKPESQQYLNLRPEEAQEDPTELGNAYTIAEQRADQPEKDLGDQALVLTPSDKHPRPPSTENPTTETTNNNAPAQANTTNPSPSETAVLRNQIVAKFNNDQEKIQEVLERYTSDNVLASTLKPAEYMRLVLGDYRFPYAKDVPALIQAAKAGKANLLKVFFSPKIHITESLAGLDLSESIFEEVSFSHNGSLALAKAKNAEFNGCFLSSKDCRGVQLGSSEINGSSWLTGVDMQDISFAEAHSLIKDQDLPNNEEAITQFLRDTSDFLESKAIVVKDLEFDMPNPKSLGNRARNSTRRLLSFASGFLKRDSEAEPEAKGSFSEIRDKLIKFNLDPREIIVNDKKISIATNNSQAIFFDIVEATRGSKSFDERLNELTRSYNQNTKKRVGEATKEEILDQLNNLPGINFAKVLVTSRTITFETLNTEALGGLTNYAKSLAQLCKTDLRDICKHIAIPSDLSGTTVESKRLDGAKLNNLYAPKIKLEGLNAAEVKLKNAFMREAEITSCDLPRLEAQNIDLAQSNISGSQMPLAQMQAARIHDATLDGIWFGSANLQNAVFDRSLLKKVYFTQQNGGSKIEADLNGTSFISSDLVDIDARGARFQLSDFNAALLGRVDFDFTNKSNNPEPKQLQYANFAGADLVGIKWPYSAQFTRRLDMSQFQPTDNKFGRPINIDPDKAYSNVDEYKNSLLTNIEKESISIMSGLLKNGANDDSIKENLLSYIERLKNPKPVIGERTPVNRINSLKAKLRSMITLSRALQTVIGNNPAAMSKEKLEQARKLIAHDLQTKGLDPKKKAGQEAFSKILDTLPEQYKEAIIKAAKRQK